MIIKINMHSSTVIVERKESGEVVFHIQAKRLKNETHIFDDQI